VHQTAGATARAPGSRALVALLVPILAMVAASYAANALWPTLVNDHPLVLLSLSSLNRYLVAATPGTDPVPFFVVAVVRLMLPDPFFFYLGRWYGDRGLGWLNRRYPSVIRSWVVFERLFRKARYPAVVIAPNNAISLLAGVERMPAKVFFPLAFVGTIGRVVLVRMTGDLFSVPVTDLLGLVERYRWWLLGLSLFAVVFGLVSDVAGHKARDEAEVAAAEARARAELGDVDGGGGRTEGDVGGDHAPGPLDDG
jgi:membrane protein DedA with SNARE-associated domain